MNLNRVAARAEGVSVAAVLAADVREAVDTVTIAAVVVTATAVAAEVGDRDAKINGADRRAVVLTVNRLDLRSVHDSTSVIPKIADRRCRSFLLAGPLGKSRWRRFWRPRTRTIM